MKVDYKTRKNGRKSCENLHKIWRNLCKVVENLEEITLKCWKIGENRQKIWEKNVEKSIKFDQKVDKNGWKLYKFN